MYPDTLPFLHALYASVQGFVTLTAIHPNNKRFAPSHHVPVENEAALENALERLHTANARGWGAYVSIATRKSNLGRWRRGGRNDLLALPALFVDIDREPELALDRLHDFPLPPSCVVRSGRGLHAYWFLTESTTEFDLANRILRGLAVHFEGDHTTVVHMLCMLRGISLRWIHIHRNGGGRILPPPWEKAKVCAAEGKTGSLSAMR